MSEPYNPEPEGWPCLLSAEVDALLADLALPADVFGAIIAVTVQINETKGYVPGSTASARWPQQHRVPLGPDGSLGVAEYVIVADVPHCVRTRVQLY
ncbi:hypothetical protein GCM10010387_50110 [Streptomyces inusitatus]|uniref:Uncharacterized protein n=1 Tax=Streptomyces inusitatus TaxID=68221 RepID=A0A918QJD2_9ACTN|nr:hypothetical protein [Streptomyces inusitatus]GGZ49806.1 hypothetical protein GCM10010387_50110 [Streptomyces inusitatus]